MKEKILAKNRVTQNHNNGDNSTKRDISQWYVYNNNIFRSKRDIEREREGKRL